MSEVEPASGKGLPVVGAGARQQRAAITAVLAEEVGRLLAASAGPAPDGGSRPQGSPRQLDPDQPLAAIGLDSLLAAELAHAVEARFGVAIPVAWLLDESPSISRLGERIQEELARIDGAAEEAPSFAAGSPSASPSDRQALSRGQQALWFLERLAPGSGAYNLAAAARVMGGLDVAALGRALQALLGRHPILRATFGNVGGKVYQRIQTDMAADYAVIEAAAWTDADLERRLSEDACRPFDLERGPLLRVRIYTRSPRQPALLLAIHHIITDFWSLAVLAGELGALYRQEAGGDTARLAPQASSNGDFVRWQEQLLAGPRGERLWSYWRQQLAGLPPALELPTDRPRPPAQTFRGGSRTRRLDPRQCRAIAALGSGQRATLFATLMAAFQVLLYRYSGQEQLAVGSPTAGRTLPRLARQLGYFVNPVVIRGDLAGEPAFGDHLARTRQTVLGALAHQDYPFPLLVERLHPQPDPSRSPLFQVLFALQRAPRTAERSLAAFTLGWGGERMRLGSLVLESLRFTRQRAQFDLSLVMAELGDSLVAALEYNADLFDAATAERMLGHLETLLQAVVEDPARPVSLLSLLTEAERNHLLVGLNDTAAAYPRHSCLHELFEGQAGRSPASVAVAWEGGSATYLELERRANQLARRLRRLGVGPEQRVGVCLERSPRMIVALLAVLKAGGAYVPLDAGYPRERLRWLLADAGIAVLITEQSRIGRLPEQGTPTIVLELAQREVEGESAEPLPATATPGNLAYLIYTSGSTGRPKAVAIEHRSAVALMHWARERFDDDDLAGVLAATSITFDLSVFEIFVPLSWGGRIVLAEDALQLAAAAPAGVRLINTVPSAMTELVRLAAIPESARTINLAGEALAGALVERIYRARPVRRVLNLYGPSEDTTYSTWAQIDPGEGRAPAIGRPIANTQAFVADARLQPAPLGVPGELLLGGEGLARGYFGRPELTAAAFIPNPWSPVPGQRLYRTGDLVRYRGDGNLEFLGRLDHQVKVRGFRVELGEIETALAEHPGARESVVLMHESSAGERRLAAFVVAAREAAPSPSELQAFLRERLPEFMVPSTVLVLPAFPLQPNGKVDRQALLAAQPRTGLPRAAAGSFVPPRSPIEELLASIWVEVLGCGPVGVEDSFFELGGHSLLAVQVLSRVRDALGVDLQVRELFSFTTVAALAGRVEALRGSGPPRELPPLAPVERREDLPLSFAQQRLWFLDRLEPGSPFYNVAFAYLVRGRLLPASFAHALREIVRRHEVLRTGFGDFADTGEPRQRIFPETKLSVPLADLGGLAAAAREAELPRLAMAEAWRPFDLAHGQLLRVRLVRLSAEVHAVLLTMHHIVSDGWSMGVLVGELAALYEAFSAGLPSPLPALPIQYADYACWQRLWLAAAARSAAVPAGAPSPGPTGSPLGSALDAELAFWRERLAGLPPLLELPTDRPRPAVATHRGRTVPVELPPALSAGIVRLARDERSTAFMCLLAALATLLARYSGQRDLAIGSPVANRNRSEIEGLIGFFANTLVMRLDLGGSPSFRALLRRVKELTLDAFAHQDVPFEKIVEELHPERNRAHTPLFQTLFVLQNAPLSIAIPGLELVPLQVDTATAKHDLTLSLTATGGGLAGWLEYATDLFDASSIHRLLSHLATLLGEIAARPDTSIEDLVLLSPAERHQLVHGWNATRVRRPVDRRLPRWFEAQARSTPAAIAAVLAEQRLSYGELNATANRLARRLRRQGVGPDSLVGICLERSLDMLVAVLGVLKAGGAYVPLDPAYPKQRLAFMLEDAPLAALLTAEPLRERLPAELPPVLCLDRAWRELSVESGDDLDDLAVEPAAENLAYVIFTSGSTGRPKGVALSHAVVSNLIEWHLGQLLGGCRTLQFASLSFDVSCLEMFATWCSGGCLFVAPEELRRDPAALARYLRDEAIEKAIFPVVMMQQLAAEWSTWPELALCLREVTTTGEQMQITPLVARLFERLPGARLHNHYGPSESHVVTALALPPLPVSWPPQPPIGRPIDNTRIHVLDARGQPAPVQVAGELFIGGLALARGYLNRPELTAEKFVADPFAAGGERLYRTGDLARVGRDGTIEYLGRIDQQIKLRGFRVEPGEIEAVLREHPAVREAFVLVREDGRGPYLAAYLTAAPGAEPAAAELRSYLRGSLPDYMIPASFVVLDRLPLTPNNKVDRQALPAPAAARGDGQAPAGTPTEELLAGVWEQLIGVEKVGRDDDFFALGGHSLLATQLVSRLRGCFGVDLPLAKVFDRPTLAGLAAEIDAARRQGASPQLPPILPAPADGKPRPLSYAQERLWLMDRLAPDNPVFNLFQAAEITGPLDVAAFARSFAAILDRHQSLCSVVASEGGRPVQVVRPPSGPVAPLVDLAAVPVRRRQEAVAALCREEARRPFKLDRGPLLRVRLLRLGDGRHVLLLTVHHIAADDWSTAILIRELKAFYQAFHAGEPAALPELQIQYADFARWQRRWLSTEALAPQLEYWRRQLHGELPVLRIRGARRRPPVLTFRGSYCPFALSRDELAAVSAVCRREAVTPFMVLLAAYAAVLHRASGQDDLVIGAAVANRNRIEIEPLIGFFVNVLPLRIELEDDPTCGELLRRVRRVCLEAYDHQDVPFELLIKELQPKRDLRHTPIRQAGLSYLGTPRLPVELAGEVVLTPLLFDSGTAPLDLTLIVWEAAGELQGYCEFSTDLFDAPQVERLLGSLRQVAAAIAASPEQSLAGLPLLAAETAPAASNRCGLTDNQSLYWFAERLQDDFYYSHVRIKLELAGEVDPEHFARAFEQAVAASDSLRSVILELDGAPCREVRQPLDVLAAAAAVELVDLSGSPDPAAALDGWLAQRLRERVTLSERLFYCALVRVEPRCWVWFLSIHHIVVDASSLGILFRYVAECYQLSLAGRLGEARRLPSFGEHAADEVAYKSSASFRRSAEYWQEKLAVEVPPCQFYRREAAAFSTEAWRKSVALGAARSDRIREVTRREGFFSKSLVALAALAAYVFRISGNRVLRIGTTFGNRREQQAQVIGLLINNCFLQTAVDGDDTFASLSRKLQGEVVAAMRHQRYPLRNFFKDRIYDVYFNYNSVKFGSFGDHPVHADLLVSGRTNNLIDVQLRDFDDTGSLWLDCEWNHAAFGEAEAERSLDHYLNLLDAFLDDPRTSLIAAPLLSPEERRQLLPEPYREPGRTSREECLHQIFAAQARRAPQATAAVYEGERLTYGELESRANRLANCLRAQGVGPEVLVGIFMERSLHLVVAILGVLKAGGAYLPMDPGYPRDRLSFMLDDSGLRLLITQAPLLDSLPAAADREVPVLCLDADWDELAGEYDDVLAELEETAPGGERLAYVIYTSGSTGRPKGSPITHANAVRLFAATRRWFGFGESDAWTLFHSPAFDFSVWELWGALLHGGRLVVVPYWVSRSAGDFYRLLAAEGITVLNQTPSAFRQLVEADGAADARDRARLRLRWVVFGGEALEPRSLAPWFERHGDRSPCLINMYGITETTVHVTYLKLTSRSAGSASSLIGAPIPDLRVYLLDRFQNLVPVGIPGEIFVSGPGLGRGYLNRPDLTAQRFLPDPFSTDPGARMYRAGDLARHQEDGGLEFLGRTDQQVKIRGFRIELPEIEAVIARHPEVRQCVVQVWEDQGGDRRLAAYVVPQGSAPEVGELRELARRALPDYMVPAAFVLLDELPLTPSGKLDRRALPPPGAEAAAAAPPGPRPRTPTEELVAGIWMDVLSLGLVGLEDDFFALGGHSLLATQVISRVRERLGIELPLRQLFEAPTVTAFAQLLDAARGEGKETGPANIQRVPRGGDLPLSFAQQRLWFLNRLEPKSPAYNVPNAYALAGQISVDDLRQVLRQLGARHESLRTSFPAVEGDPVQRIAATCAFELPSIDLGSLSAAGRGRQLRRLAQEEAEQPFDLARGPLLRLRLVRMSADEHAIFVTMHHIISDGWSMNIFVREMMALYEARLLRRPAVLPAPAAVQYADFACWQREWMQGDALATELAYWQAQLAGIPPVLELPTDRPRPALQSARGAQHLMALPAPLVGALKAAVRGTGVTSFMTLLAGFYALLLRYSGQEDLAVGTPIAGRNRVEIESLIGFFVNMLVLRLDLSGDPTLRAVLERVREMTLGAYSHQNLPFEKLVQELRPERNLAHAPLIQTVFVMQDAPMKAVELPTGVRLTPLPTRVRTTKFDLTLSLAETGEGIEAVLEYNRDLWDAATAVRLASHYRELLQAIGAGDLDRRFHELPLLLAGERHQLLVEWSDVVSAGDPQCLHQLFEAQAALTPGATAVMAGELALTYAELDRRGERVARSLRALGLGAEGRVALFMDRTLDLAVAVLGILKAGAAYVPLDPAYPRDRIAFMLDDAMAEAEAPLMLTQRHLLDDARARMSRTAAAGRAAQKAQPGRRVRVAALEDLEDESREARVGAPPVDPANLAYVIYTSGSTGRPKGVAIAHRNAVAFVRWAVAAFSRAELSAVLASTSICFDLSVFELFAPWSVGGRAVLVDNLFDLAAAPPAEVSLINTVPSTMAALLETTPVPAAVLAVNLAGEALSQALVDRLCDRPGAPRVLNLYGPTEDTIYSTCAATAAGRSGPPAIGRPLSQTVLRVLDRHLQPVPLGVPGELYVGGAGTARGYLNRPDLTAERFVPDATAQAPGMRVYRTGDLVRYRPDGQLDFLGRLDHQLKLRGFRIELGEIEALLDAHPRIREAVVVAVEQDGERRLVAYVAPRQEALPAGSIREYLQQQLPEYMVPQAYVMLDSLPRNTNGKVDRKALLAREGPGAGESAARYVAPRSRGELQLARIWEDLLGVAPIGVTADFFELGGHSLLALSLMAQIRKRLGRELPLSALFQASTVERLAGALQHASVVDRRQSPLLELHGGNGLSAPLFLVHAVGGGVLPYLDLARRLGPAQPVFAFQSPGLDGSAEPLASVEAMAALYVRELQRQQPEDPYFLGGWSMGGVVAFEMARQLRAGGNEVARVFLLDSHLPAAAAAWDPAALAVAFARDLVRHSLEDLPMSIEQFRALPGEEQLRVTLDLARVKGLLPPSMAAEQFRVLFEIHQQNLRAFLDYRPQPYGGRLNLFRAAGGQADSAAGLDGDLGWGALCALPIEIEKVPGDHYTMLAGDNSKVLAERLGAHLAADHADGRKLSRSVLDAAAGGGPADLRT